MKAKQLLSLAAASLFTLAVSAQSKTTFGITAGVNFQNITGDDALGNKMENKLKTGFLAGVNAEIPVGIDFYVQPGVIYAMKGAKADNNSDDKVNLSYIEVPVNFIYKPAVGTGRIILGVGPYVAFGIGGKIKSNSGDVDVEFKNSISQAEAASGYGSYFKRIDAGGNLLFGYEMANHLSLQLNAQLGMIKINPKIDGLSSDETSWKNTGFGVSLGYRF